MRLNIKGKLIGLVAGVCTLALIAACAAFVWYDRKSYAEAKKVTMTVLADAIAGSAYGPTAFGDAESAKYVLETLGSEPTAVRAGIFSQEGGERLAGWFKEGSDDAVSSLGEVRDGAHYTGQALTIVRPIAKDGERVGTLIVELSTADIAARTQQFLRIALAVLVGALLFAMLAALRLHSVISTPVQALASSATRVRDSSDYSIRVEKQSDDELGVLTEAFNAMLSGIERRDQELELHRSNLESKVEERTQALAVRNRALRLVMDNVGQAIVTVEADGTPSEECSARYAAWFGPPRAGVRFDEQIREHDGAFADWFELGWEALHDGIMPTEVTLAQMPERLEADGRSLSVEYRPIGTDDEVEKLLVIVSDITAQVERERAEAEQRDFLAMFQRLMVDRDGFMEFFDEATSLVEAVVSGDDIVLMKRALHTLKGNCALFGIHTVSKLCHELEDTIDETCAVLDGAGRDRLVAGWESITQRLKVLAPDGRELLSVDPEDYDRLRELISEGASYEVILDSLDRWQHDRASVRLERVADQTRALGRRLDKGTIDVEIEPNNVRIPHERWSTFWSAFSHVVRNAVDHGLEAPDERVAAGKPAKGRIRLATRLEDGVCTVEIEDDGRGIDWGAVAAKAQSLGLPADTTSDLRDALLSDGVSTRTTITETSGRGVGMAALRSVCDELGASIVVQSDLGVGTRFAISFPATASMEFEG